MTDKKELFRFDQVLNTWLEHLPASRVPVNTEQRKQAFLELFAYIREYGFVPEEIEQIVRERFKKIVDVSHVPTSRNASKWRAMVEKDLNGALARINPSLIGVVDDELIRLKPAPDSDPSVNIAQFKIINPLGLSGGLSDEIDIHMGEDLEKLLDEGGNE